MLVVKNKLATACAVIVAVFAFVFTGVGNLDSVTTDGFIRSASAEDESTLTKLKGYAREAMENYDLMEYEDAKRLLAKAIVLAKRKRLNNHPLMAQLYLHLGIVYFSGFQDVESAKVAFIDAVSVDPKIRVNPAYRTAELDKLLADAKKEFGSDGGSDRGGDTDVARKPKKPKEPEVDCDEVVGILHTLVDTADAGADKKVSANVAADLKAAKVSLYYRSQGKSEFGEAKMSRRGDCTYVGTIPKASMVGDVVHYYIAVTNKSGKVIAKKGSAASPNIMELAALTGGDTGAGGAGGDIENPLSGRSSSGSSGGDLSGSAGGGSSSGGSAFYVSLAVGTGGGYVSGSTEQARQDVGCCFAPALLHILPEVGYRMSSKNSLAVAFRLGLPIGADLPGRATAAPAVLVRYRHSLNEDGLGLGVSGVVGGGFIRHTVPLANDMGTDTSATGPLFVGAGAHYIKPMSGSLSLVAEANTLLGIPVISEIGSCPDDPSCIRPNFALQLDLNLGVRLVF